jgi:hypothetical protein
MTAYERRKQLSIEACRVFFKNIDYLRQQRGLSFHELSRQVSGEGFKVSADAVSCYSGRRGWGGSKGFGAASTYYLAAYADYFGYSIPYLMSRDLAAEDDLNKEAK